MHVVSKQKFIIKSHQNRPLALSLFYEIQTSLLIWTNCHMNQIDKDLTKKLPEQLQLHGSNMKGRCNLKSRLTILTIKKIKLNYRINGQWEIRINGQREILQNDHRTRSTRFITNFNTYHHLKNRKKKNVIYSTYVHDTKSPRCKYHFNFIECPQMDLMQVIIKYTCAYSAV